MKMKESIESALRSLRDKNLKATELKLQRILETLLVTEQKEEKQDLYSNQDSSVYGLADSARDAVRIGSYDKAYNILTSLLKRIEQSGMPDWMDTYSMETFTPEVLSYVEQESKEQMLKVKDTLDEIMDQAKEGNMDNGSLTSTIRALQDAYQVIRKLEPIVVTLHVRRGIFQATRMLETELGKMRIGMTNKDIDNLLKLISGLKSIL